MTNSPDLNPLDYHVWGAMLECYKTFNPSHIPLTKVSESLAKNMGWSITELRQPGCSELYQKTSSLCESWGQTLWTRLQI